MSPSTISLNNNTQGSMVPDRRHSVARAGFKAGLLEEIDPSIFEYHTKRETGLIPQNEDPRWGYEDPRQRHAINFRYNNLHVAQSFFKVDWDKGFTGQGVDFRYRDNRLEGPKGETLEHIAGAEAPTLPEARRLYRMVDKGIDEGVDPLYDGPPIDWDEDTTWSDDEDVDPLGQTEVDGEIGPVTESQQHAQVEASGEMRRYLQDIAAQAFQVLGDNDLGLFNGTRQEAELDPSGEMKDVLGQIVDESYQTPDDYQATTNVPAALESSPEATKHLGKKRDWASLREVGNDASDEGSNDEGSRGPKRLRIWHAEGADTLGEVNDISADNIGEDSRTEASSSKLKRSRTLQADGLDEDDSSDGEWQPQPKRQRVRFEQPVEARRTVGRGYDTSNNSKVDNSSNDVDSSETDASSIDSGLSKFNSDQALGPVKTRARPTFYGISVQTNKVTKTECVPDNNETDDIVVTHVRKSQPRAYEYSPGLPPRIEPKPRPWTEEEEEDLRSWVQDYGMQRKWSEVARCLNRSEDDCQTRYREIVTARNKRAGRDAEAGLSGWVDHELEVTPEEIAQLVAEDLAKREAARTKKADQQAQGSRGISC